MQCQYRLNYHTLKCLLYIRGLQCNQASRQRDVRWTARGLIFPHPESDIHPPSHATHSYSIGSTRTRATIKKDSKIIRGFHHWAWGGISVRVSVRPMWSAHMWEWFLWVPTYNFNAHGGIFLKPGNLVCTFSLIICSEISRLNVWIASQTWEEGRSRGRAPDRQLSWRLTEAWVNLSDVMTSYGYANDSKTTSKNC